jgi:hypothetical protein
MAHMQPNLPTGTKVRIATMPLDGSGPDWSETGRVMRWRRSMGKPEQIPGYHPIRFDRDGATLMVHRRGLMVCNGAPRT